LWMRGSIAIVSRRLARRHRLAIAAGAQQLATAMTGQLAVRYQRLAGDQHMMHADCFGLQPRSGRDSETVPAREAA
jgi:hypothetical protein